MSVNRPNGQPPEINWQLPKSRIPLLKRAVNRPVIVADADSFASTSQVVAGETPKKTAARLRSGEDLSRHGVILLPPPPAASGWRRLLHPTQWLGIRSLYHRFVLPRKIRAQINTLLNPNRRVDANEQQARYAGEIQEISEESPGREAALAKFNQFLTDNPTVALANILPIHMPLRVKERVSVSRYHNRTH